MFCFVFVLLSTHPRSRVSYKTDSVRMDFVNSKKTQASVLPAIIKSFGPTFLFGALLKLTQDILTFASPQILRYAKSPPL